MVKIFLLLFAKLILTLTPQYNAWSQSELIIYSGAALKEPVEDLVDLYKIQSKKGLFLNLGNVISLISQINLSKKGDIIIMPSADLIDSLVQKNLVLKDSIKPLTYQVPVILVQKGNPKNIKSLRDLLREDVRLAIANPETVYLGMVSAELFEKNF